MPGLPIKVTCECRHRFRAKARLAGRVVKCPSCETSSAIPRLSMVATRDQEWESCPDCCGPLLATAEVCQSCNYSRTGKTRSEKAATFLYRVVPCVLGATALTCLVQTQLSSVVFVWLYGFLGLCCVATTIGAGNCDLVKRDAFILSLVAYELVGFVRDSYGTADEFETVWLYGMMICYPVGAFVLFTMLYGVDDPDWFSFQSRGVGYGGTGGGCGGAVSGGGSCGGGGSGCGGCGGGD